MFVVHPPSTRSAVLRMCRRGLSSAEVARTLGIASQTVNRWRHAAKIPRSKPARKYSDAIRRTAMAMFRKGRKLAEIAEATGASTRTIWWWSRELKTSRTKPVDRHRHDASTRARAVEMYASGKPARYVAEVMGDGINWHTVIGWARAAGVPIRVGNHAPRIDHARASEIYARTRSLRLTARELGCSSTGVRKALDRGIVAKVRAELRRETT